MFYYLYFCISCIISRTYYILCLCYYTSLYQRSFLVLVFGILSIILWFDNMNDHV